MSISKFGTHAAEMPDFFNRAFIGVLYGEEIGIEPQPLSLGTLVLNKDFELWKAWKKERYGRDAEGIGDFTQWCGRAGCEADDTLERNQLSHF